MKHIHPKSEIFALGGPYLLIVSISLIPSAINNMVRRYLEGLSNERMGLFLGFFTLVVNVLLNFLFIYGKYGFPALGLNGAGMAIVMAEILSAILGLLYVIYGLKPNCHIMYLSPPQFSFNLFRTIWQTGFPVGIQFGIEGIYLLFITVIIGWISIEAQAAHAIIFNICQLITIFSVGLGLTGSLLVAQQRGSKNGCLVKKIASTACVMVESVSLIIGFIILGLHSYIVDFYKPEADVRAVVDILIKHLCIFQLFCSVCYWGNSVLRGLNDKVWPFICNISTQFAGAVMCYMLVVQQQWGIHGMWLTLILERMLLACLLLCRFELNIKKLIGNRQV